jgi:hypothetical protein
MDIRTGMEPFAKGKNLSLLPEIEAALKQNAIREFVVILYRVFLSTFPR